MTTINEAPRALYVGVLIFDWNIAPSVLVGEAPEDVQREAVKAVAKVVDEDFLARHPVSVDMTGPDVAAWLHGCADEPDFEYFEYREDRKRLFGSTGRWMRPRRFPVDS